MTRVSSIVRYFSPMIDSELRGGHGYAGFVDVSERGLERVEMGGTGQNMLPMDAIPGESAIRAPSSIKQTVQRLILRREEEISPSTGTMVVL